ncbi:DnaJ domain-containing protein [Raineya orbicola]|uniref:DnaJ domain n=1 Tax=Raineya orbicola TaxID=2016530 RepID=A0A2N3IKS7_9BACT|nr:DnaJ domain-containing protein [Raineya orbicola]PKQ70930.1 DnaJ domain [Raineya orbicola]
MKNYYTILEVPESASVEMIKSAYRNLAKKWHPDLNPGNAEAEQMFMDIKEAYSVLSNAIKRNFYDYQLRKAILDKKVEPTSSTKVGSFRKTETTTKKTTSNQDKTEKNDKKEKLFHNAEAYKNRLDELMRKHNELIEKQKKAAEEAKKKDAEKEESFYEKFKQNRENAILEQKIKQQQEQEAKAKQEEQKQKEQEQKEEANITRPQKNRIKAILSILGFRSD